MRQILAEPAADVDSEQSAANSPRSRFITSSIATWRSRVPRNKQLLRSVSAQFDTAGLVMPKEQVAKDDKAVAVIVTVHAIGALDPLNSQFAATVNLKMKWSEPTASEMWTDESTFSKISHVELQLNQTGLVAADERIHVPALAVENLYSTVRDFAPRLEIRRDDLPGTIRWERMVQGLFYDVFTVKTFPFDVQAPHTPISARPCATRRDLALPPLGAARRDLAQPRLVARLGATLRRG